MTEPIALEKKGCRVFVSYSHKDSKKYVNQFMEIFKLELRGSSQLGITPEQVFFDRNNLLAGDEWHESIQCALEEADYFVFLVSAHSLSSEFCYSRELAIAVGKALPIIQIVLNYCPWEKQPLPGDSKKRTLGDLGALPKDDRFSLKPIAEWRNQHYAWNEVVKQLTERLSKDQSQPITSRLTSAIEAVAQSCSRLGSLLPYFCNQTVPVNEFQRQVKTWNRTALLVLTKGVHNDNTPRFWERLQNKNLKDYLATHNEQLLESARRFVWPLSDGEVPKAEDLTSDMMSALSDALTGNASQLNDASSLAQWLSTSPHVVPLVTTLPRASKEIIAAGIRALLDLLERCSTETPLNRLVIAMLIEDDSLISEKNLGKALKIPGYQRTHLIDLAPLKEIDQDDIKRWHRDYEIEKLCCVDEENLLKSVFTDALIHSLRMRQFAEKLSKFYDR
nr:toll/interleukin-1 receptor domain-containing protein [Nitrosomonas communis]